MCEKLPAYWRKLLLAFCELRLYGVLGSSQLAHNNALATAIASIWGRRCVLRKVLRCVAGIGTKGSTNHGGDKPGSLNCRDGRYHRSQLGWCVQALEPHTIHRSAWKVNSRTFVGA